MFGERLRDMQRRQADVPEWQVRVGPGEQQRVDRVGDVLVGEHRMSFSQGIHEVGIERRCLAAGEMRQPPAERLQRQRMSRPAEAGPQRPVKLSRQQLPRRRDRVMLGDQRHRARQRQPAVGAATLPRLVQMCGRQRI